MLRKLAGLAAAAALAATLSGCSGAAGDYAASRDAYQKEVEAWKTARETAEQYVPSCREFAGEQECAALSAALDEASTKTLNLNAAQAENPKKEDVTALDAETTKISEARARLEKASGVVIGKVEAKLASEFPRLLDESARKVTEAGQRADSLAGKVQDEAVLTAVRDAAARLLAACKKWEGVDIPGGAEGIAAYSELQRLKGALEDAVSKADTSNLDFQSAESKRLGEEAEKRKQEEEKKAQAEGQEGGHPAVAHNGDTVSLTGSLSATDACGDPSLSDYVYLLHLDQPVTFEGNWPDGPGSKSVDVIQVATSKSSGHECGPFDPWHGFTGQRVIVEGELHAEDGHWAPLVFSGGHPGD